MKSLLFILLIFVAFGARAQTYSITGTVSDEKGPLPGATVFLVNTKIATATDGSGKFILSNMQPGTYEVVVKMLGFEPSIQNVIINEKPVNITIRLKESITALKAVTIIGSPDPNRELYLTWFIRYFIGETVNAEKCKLLNPEALHFHFDKDKRILTASADEFLAVDNKALGYKLKYLLTEFELNFKTGLCTNAGYPYFEELKGSEVEQTRWMNNRRLAYLSSDRHFYRAIMNNTAKEEGFKIYQIIDDPIVVHNTPRNEHWVFYEYTDDSRKTKLVNIRLSNIDSLFTGNQNFKTLIANRKVIGNDTTMLGFYVAYTGEYEQPLFYRTGGPIDLSVKFDPPRRQISKIQMLADTIMIDKNGVAKPAKGYKYSGYWAWERIADLTPLDYFVEPVLIKSNR